MSGHWVELLKILGVNGTVLGVTTLSGIEIILKIVLLLVTIVWTVIKILDALERKEEGNNARIQRPKDGEKETTEV
tara:strand:- start:12324 stop:12551 length:228 start_codon:yes stop_codon:yes gene_type:complete